MRSGVTGKSRDDLQAVMAMVRGGDLGQPFQFNKLPRLIATTCALFMSDAA